MRPNHEIKKLIRVLKINPSAELDARVNSAIDNALAKRKQIDSAWPSIGRIIMRSPVTKLAAAAVVIIAVLAGIYFITGKPPAVTCCTWADIIRPIMDANTAEFDIIIGEEGKGPVIHDMIMGSKIHRTMEGMAESSIIDLASSQILSLDPVRKKAVYISLKDLPQIPNYLDQLRNVITMLEAIPGFTVEDLGDQMVIAESRGGLGRVETT